MSNYASLDSIVASQSVNDSTIPCCFCITLIFRHQEITVQT